MSDSEQSEFKVVDRRRAAQTDAQDQQVSGDPDLSRASEESGASDAAAGAQETGQDTSASSDPSDDDDAGDFQLPDPGLLISMAAMQMSARQLAAALLPVFDSLAWRAMGLIGDPKTGEPAKDLPAAQLSIDFVQFVLGKIENDLSESDRRDAQRRLTDLRMNYLAKSREA